jgi:hypothetical protein
MIDQWTPQELDYFRFNDYYKLNGERHLANAISYASAGYRDRFYEGSMRKAIRNFDRARPIFTLADFIERLQRPMMERIAEQIADDIIKSGNDILWFNEVPHTRMERFKIRWMDFKLRIKDAWYILTGGDYDLERW